MADRYDRQNRQRGWSQEKLTEATALVFGSGVMAQHMLTNMVSLGIGNIFIYDNKRIERKNHSEFLLSEGEIGDKKVEVLEKKLLEMNRLVNVTGIHWDIDRPYFLDPVLPPAIDVIINANSSPTNELILYEFGKANGIPVLDMDAARHLGKISCLLPGKNIREAYLSEGFYRENGEDPFTAALMSSILIDEERKIHHPLQDNENILDDTLYYYELSDRQFSLKMKSRSNPQVKEDVKRFVETRDDFYKGITAVVVGAGSLGVPVMQGLAEKGVGTIVNVDTDIAEEVNLNRQYLHYRSVGMKKVYSLCSELEAIYPGPRYVPVDDWFTENFRFNGKAPDLIFDCVDSYNSRKEINRYAVKNKVKVISGGTGFSSGRVMMYDPGKTLCLDCMLGIEEKAAEETARASCVEVSQASVIVSNRIIAAMMINSMDLMFAGHPFNGTLSYDSASELRLGRQPAYQVCDCHSRR